MTTIEDLPIELLPFIFKNLGIKDLTKARLVCQKWKYYCDKQKIEELTVVCKGNIFGSKHWYHLYRPIVMDNLIKLDITGSQYRIFKTCILKLNLLSGLKRLMIYSDSIESSALFVHLYHFAKLEQLDIQFEFDGFTNLAISHSNLRILFIKSWICNDDSVEIHCEKLEVFRMRGQLDDIVITYPDRIKNLSVSLIDDSINVLSDYKNLEILTTRDNRMDSAIIRNNSHLKEIRFVSRDGEEDEDRLINSTQDFRNFEESITNILNLKSSLERTNLKIYYDEVEIYHEYAHEILSEILFQLYNDESKLPETSESDSEEDNMDLSSLNNSIIEISDSSSQNSIMED